ncbi:MAG TPA: PP2C family protein-serine/threonine phosphatase [Thermoanaerobaculia bacterium]|nr:PP2C family protein-serine/threonine phosphatase [Thermoanaerobaculia bacterium]
MRTKTTFRLPVALLLGALFLPAGLALARHWLPEWQPGLRDRSFYVQRYRELARRAGVRLSPGAPRSALIVDTERKDSRAKEWDHLGPDRVAALGAGLRIKVSHPGTPPGASGPLPFLVEMSPEGRPLVLRWSLSAAKAVRNNGRLSSPPPQERVATLARLMLAPGEHLGRLSEDGSEYELPGSDPPQELTLQAPSTEIVVLERELSGNGSRSGDSDRDSLPFILLVALPHGLGILTTVVLLLRLISQRRIDYANGLFLGALSFAASIAGVESLSNWQEGLGQIVSACFLSLWIVASWSVGESYLRSIRPGFATVLDSLRLRRLGPRGGRALLYGVGLGALLAGLRLATFSLTVPIPGVWPGEPSLRLPPLGQINPFSHGALLASAMALALALALRYVPERWVPWVATGLGGLALSLVFVSIVPVPAWLAANVAMAGFLVWVLWRFGLTTTLVSATASYLLPVAAFSLLHLDWLPIPLVVTAGSSIALIVLGWVGLRQPEQIELEGRRAPAFIRRIEEEQRQHHELSLLRGMQLGLLPQVPEVPGWEIAVRSLLATEAGGDLYDFLDDEEGGLWIAAGDVAGHGYSCAIAQAMTAASLASLVNASQTPPGILQRVDRVLRRNGAHRHFTSLALLRLDPRTGQGRFANAGHPFPLLAADGEVSEIAAAGLPLGQGPRREYQEIPVAIPPGGVLVFCSDGLFEGTDWQGIPYGYDRPRDLLKTLDGKPAAEILEALLADWRRHLGAQEQQDDTTVLVIRRT